MKGCGANAIFDVLVPDSNKKNAFAKAAKKAINHARFISHKGRVLYKKVHGYDVFTRVFDMQSYAACQSEKVKANADWRINLLRLRAIFASSHQQAQLRLKKVFIAVMLA